ncbi:unnamed protein product [Leptidea sinapis]|uniref:CS domain-containing protein n=1 Tax=Leptidea sinapis TaxID=189913 RepID=A0A5E4QGM1_9NEOP|nr:unnamed protein product [Leptidea sinapis]
MNDSKENPAEPVKPKIKHDWYQTDAFVVVTILIKNAVKEKVKVHYGEHSCEHFYITKSRKVARLSWSCILFSYLKYKRT